MTNGLKHIGDVQGPMDLFEARVMIIALFGALDATSEALAAKSGGYDEDWISALEAEIMTSAKGTITPATEEAEAEATRKTLEALKCHFARLRNRVDRA
ncbi:hypothetical protein [Consotaella aegiceratis]|uniref:hypothetical protein n=1 Tax=Consotaella aegiceratis TaxID=3097961 RepID=UPI002F418472